MISVIYGAKGSGKTKRIIDSANAAGANASGQVIYITDNEKSLAVSSDVRFVNLGEYGVKTESEFIGFLKGMLATNFDIQKVYVDSLSRLLGKSAEELSSAFTAIEALPGNIDYIVAVSAETLPAYLKKYAAK